MALLVCVGLVLLVARKTRLLGKRLIYASLATGPALAASFLAAAIGVMILAFALSQIVKPWTHDGQVDEGVVGTLFAYSLLGALLLAAAFVAASVAAAWRIGWKMASGPSMWEVIEADPILRRLDPWYRRREEKQPAA